MEEESCCVPPGFRFHPTEEELVGYYLARKVASHKIDLDIIQEVDLYRIEPWDLQERCKQHGGGEQSMECYFFSHKDRKYPSGTRTNRATAAGFWKATGRDKPVLSSSSTSRVIGMRKTLVFYKGRAPNGRKTEWIIHEYRLQSNHHHAAPVAQEEGWVVCRAFHKPVPNQRPFFPSYGADTPAGYYYDHHLPNARLHLLGSAPHPDGGNGGLFPQLYADEFESKNHHLLSIPQLESPTADGYIVQRSNNDSAAEQEMAAGAIDWNFLDILLASQLHEPSTSLH